MSLAMREIQGSVRVELVEIGFQQQQYRRGTYILSSWLQLVMDITEIATLQDSLLIFLHSWLTNSVFQCGSERKHGKESNAKTVMYRSLYCSLKRICKKKTFKIQTLRHSYITHYIIYMQKNIQVCYDRGRTPRYGNDIRGEDQNRSLHGATACNLCY